MKTAAKKSAKVSAKKVAPKKVAKKEKVARVITRADFPEAGWGLSKKQHDQIAAFAIKNGYKNLSEVKRFALIKVGACTAE